MAALSKLSQIDKDQIHLEYLLNTPIRSIATMFGVSKARIYDIARELNLPLRRPYNGRQYLLNESVFDDPANNPEAAYWIGFLAADGTVTDKGTVSLALAGEDGLHLKQYKQFLGYSGPLPIYYNKHGFGKTNSQPITFLGIRSKRICAELAKHYVVPRKTFITKASKDLENNLYFWCGTICGDGWVATDNTGRSIIGLTGASKEFLQQFVDFANSITKTNCQVLKSREMFRVTYNSKAAKILSRELFGKCPFALTRKLREAEKHFPLQKSELR